MKIEQVKYVRENYESAIEGANNLLWKLERPETTIYINGSGDLAQCYSKTAPFSVLDKNVIKLLVEERRHALSMELANLNASVEVAEEVLNGRLVTLNAKSRG
ncbi:hypothetical protein PP754_gp034 [Pectobacterium phage Possum]|uniref:Uncharacterized protein n=1 Tax=Pectobacterium phage Possum TaxID=2686301 RepID=A0A7T0LVN6_9CAUD|nr:hypothetical protein PP754_gp034 [Pectobacterium phage Possum]QPL10875.1 hypothetical protein Possum_00034 [Pectobacterium phage Possum]QPL10977.1 hypothetical protein Horatius_00034 [Pectobacterium phage Horatius]